MTNLNVSMPEAMKEFIEAEVRTGSYSTPSEFVRDLVRDFQRRKASEGEQRLIAALLSGRPIADDPVLEAIHQKLRAGVDQKLIAALNNGPAVPGEDVMARLRKKNQARGQTAK
jgi:antitoxin ParD1/3/4